MDIQEPSAPVFDRASLLERVGGDVDFLQELTQLFLDDCPRMMQEIRTACERRDPAELTNAAHALKGCVANFGAEPVREAAWQLEQIGRSGELHLAPRAWAVLEAEIDRFREALQRLGSELAES